MPAIDRWNALAERYASDVTEIQPTSTHELHAEILRLTDVTDRSAVLDLGCGPGQLARHFARQGATVTAVDASTQLLDIARRHDERELLGITYLESDAAAPDLLPDGRFDVIASTMALSDIDDLAGTLENVRRLLDEEGRFVFTILHPCFPGAGSSLASWPPAGYFQEGWWLAEGHHGYRGVVGANHRTLSTYMNALVHHGLALDEMAEWSPPDTIAPMFLS